MANRYFKQHVLTKGARTVLLAGKIVIASDASVTSSTVDFATVTKLSTGTYQILLDDKYVKTKAVSLTPLQAAGVVPVQLVMKTDSQASDKKLIFNTYIQDGISGVPAVADTGVALEIHVIIVLNDSTVTN